MNTLIYLCNCIRHIDKQLPQLVQFLILTLAVHTNIYVSAQSIESNQKPKNKTSLNQASSKNDLTQTVRGQVLDRTSNQPLVGATIILVDSTKKNGSFTDADGRFELKNISLGRRNFIVKYIGYEDILLPNILIISGKEAVLNVTMQEQVITTNIVEITSDAQKEQALNSTASVSTRTFSVDEANRFAGAFGDPSRMVRNYAGVSTPNDSRNDIIIRGNSPMGMLWRLEGIDIFNPNHFGSQGANGGPISMLNNNLLGNSDFYTSAFPSEYGNATSGVFDLRLRNGNNNRFETQFQLGFNGLEAMIEGPFNRKKNQSFLVSYRYSTLAIFSSLGLRFGELNAVPYYQDISFKLNLPTAKAGTFTIFGLGGESHIDILESKLNQKEVDRLLRTLDFRDARLQNWVGTIGASHSITLGSRTYMKTTLASMIENRTLLQDSISPVNRSILPDYGERVRNMKQALHWQLNHKFNSQHSLRVGLQADLFMVSARDSSYREDLSRFITLRDADATTALIRLYGNWQYRITKSITLNTGFNLQTLTLNGKTGIDPRVGVRYQINARHSVSAGYGLHHQIQPLLVYFLRNPQTGNYDNQDVGLTRSQHSVFGYDWSIAPNIRLKAEAYFQYIDNVPVDGATASSFSVLNIGANFNSLPNITTLANKGAGRNYGLELTLEKFLSKNYYFLVTASLFDSRYRGSDNIWRSTAFNNNWVLNALAGGELPVGKRKNTVLFADIQVSVAGGVRLSPLDTVASREAGTTVTDDSRAFSQRGKPYFRMDLKVGARQNFKKFSLEFAFQAQNVANYQNLFFRSWNPVLNREVNRYQVGFFPIGLFKVNF